MCILCFVVYIPVPALLNGDAFTQGWLVLQEVKSYDLRVSKYFQSEAMRDLTQVMT